MKLEIRNGCFAYQKQKMILNNVNLRVDSGDLLAILGPNGAGKTTLLKCLMGFLKWQKGKTYLDDVPLSKLSKKEQWQKIAYVPQAKNTMSAYSVEEMILLGCSNHLNAFQKPNSDDYLLVEEVMRQLHLEKLSGKKCSMLSGGELQMVLIARALVSKPQILILDEPESNLDFKNQLIVLETMNDLVKKGLTVIFNTHYPDHALQYANKALIACYDGTYTFGNTKDVLSEEMIKKAFSVEAIISEVETPTRVINNVIPLEIINEQANVLINNPDENKLATIAIIFENRELAVSINAILHEYAQYIVGRMGMPYGKEQIHIINVVLDAPVSILNELSTKLERYKEISVKTTFQK